MQHRNPAARWLILPVLAVIFTMTAPPVPAQIVASIKGKLEDIDGNALAKVPIFVEIIRVEGRAAGPVGKVKTRKNGSFTYPFLDPGEYKVYPQLEGYVVIRMTVLSIDSQKNVRAGESGGKPTEHLISRDQGNLPTVPLAPQGNTGRCEVNITVVKDEDYVATLAAIQKGNQAPSTATAAPVVSRKRDPVERGDEYFAGGDWGKAIAAYEEAIEDDPADPEAAYGLGKSLLRNDDLSGAQAALMKASQLDPEMPGVNFYLATIYHDLAQDAAAIAALEKERTNSPETEEVLVNLGTLYRDTEQPEKAMEILTEVITLNPENTDAFMALADVHNQLAHKSDSASVRAEETAKAEAIYKQILTQSPGQEDVIWYNIGVNAYNADNKSEAASAFQKSLNANPKNPEAHKMLGYTLVGLGKTDEAIPHFEKYLKLEPKGGDVDTVNGMLTALKQS